MRRITLLLLFFMCLFSCNSERRKETKIPIKAVEIPLESVEEVEKRIGRKVNVQEYVLSQNSEDFYERISTVNIFGRINDGRMFTGVVMWFKNYYDENMSSNGTFHDFLKDIVNNQQDIELIDKIVSDSYIFSKSPEVFQHVENPISKIINQFTYKRELGDQFYLKKIFLKSFDIKYSISYLFYRNGYILIEDDYEPSSSFIPIDKLY